MKRRHRGHLIEVTRDRSLGGWSNLYFSVFRDSDGYECLSSFEDSTQTVPGKIQELRDRIDAELDSDDPWGERAEEGEVDREDDERWDPLDVHEDQDFWAVLDQCGYSAQPLAIFAAKDDAERWLAAYEERAKKEGGLEVVVCLLCDLAGNVWNSTEVDPRA